MRYCDTWKKQVPDEKLAAYKTLLDNGSIGNPHVVYSRSEKITIIEYDSDHPHEWVLDELRKAVR